MVSMLMMMTMVCRWMLMLLLLLCCLVERASTSRVERWGREDATGGCLAFQ